MTRAIGFGGAKKNHHRAFQIPQITWASYQVTVGLGYLQKYVGDLVEEWGMDLDVDFQRAHVWNRRQQVRFMEWMLRGGRSGMDIQANCPTWKAGGARSSEYVIVDGKQRLTAALAFLNDEFEVFAGEPYGGNASSYGHRFGIGVGFTWNVNDLETRAEVLQWYLDLNDGGVVHTDDELSKVREMLEKEG